MYEYCKKSITRKIEKGTLTPELAEDFKMKLAVFYWNDEMTEEEYNELLELLTSNNPGQSETV